MYNVSATWFSKRTKYINIEVFKGTGDACRKLLLLTIKRKYFTSICGLKTSLTPILYKKQYSYTKERVFCCKQFENDYIGWIELIDSVSKSLEKLICQTIFYYTDKEGNQLFVVVDSSIFLGEVNFTLPTNHSLVSHNRMLAIVPYLYKNNGMSILQFLI